MMTAIELAEAIRNANEWDLEQCEMLCELAGLEEEWKAADGDNFETVVEKAAKILGVELHKWYAVQETKEDAWDNGSYNFGEAVKMLKEQGHGLIAVINDDYCEQEITYEEVAE